MGLATAYDLSENTDSQVLVLDRYGVGNELCSSNDANRVFRYCYGKDELYTSMAVESHSLWRQLENKSGNELLTETGLLLLQGEDENANAFNEASYRTLSQKRLGAEKLDRKELKKRFPQFTSEGAYFDPHGGVLLASKSLHTLQELTASRGVTHQREHVRNIFPADHRITTDSQTLEFRKLIVTIGPWTNALRPEGLLPIRATRQQLIYIRPKTGLEQFRAGKCPVFFADKHYGLPAEGTDAVKISPKELTESVDPETADRTVDREQISECKDACKKFVPGLAEGEVVRTKVCLYDMTENSDFVIDRDPENRDIIYGYGFSGHGFKFAPLIGKLLAELALERTPSFDLTRFTTKAFGRRKPTLGAHLGKGE